MADWTVRTQWGARIDPGDLWVWETLARERLKSLKGLTLLRNSGPRPLEIEEGRVMRS